MNDVRTDNLQAAENEAEQYALKRLALNALARALSSTVREIRLRRIGVDPDLEPPPVDFDQLPDDEQQNWHDMARATYDLIQLARTDNAESHDRQRRALEAIAAGDVPGVTFADPDLISAFAQQALDEP